MLKNGQAYRKIFKVCGPFFNIIHEKVNYFLEVLQSVFKKTVLNLILFQEHFDPKPVKKIEHMIYGKLKEQPPKGILKTIFGLQQKGFLPPADILID